MDLPISVFIIYHYIYYYYDLKITLNSLGLVTCLPLGSPPLPLDGRVLAKFAQILGIPNNSYKPNLVQKFSRIKVYNTLAPPPFFYMEEKFGPLEKRIKTIDINRDQNFQKFSGIRTL